MQFLLFKRSFDPPLCMKYDIIKMTATASVGGAHTKGPIFHDSGAQIGLYLIDGVADVDFKNIGGLRLVGIDLRLKKTSQEKVLRGQIARSRLTVHVAFVRYDHFRKLLVQKIHRSVCCVARSPILL